METVIFLPELFLVIKPAITESTNGYRLLLNGAPVYHEETDLSPLGVAADLLRLLLHIMKGLINRSLY